MAATASPPAGSLGSSPASRQSESRIRAERRAGELLRDMEKAKGAPGNQHTGKVDRSSDVTGPPPLSDLGISKQQSSNWQRLATVPQEIFDDELKHASRPTTSANIEQVIQPTIKVGSILPKVGTLLLF